MINWDLNEHILYFDCAMVDQVEQEYNHRQIYLIYSKIYFFVKILKKCQLVTFWTLTATTPDRSLPVK